MIPRVPSSIKERVTRIGGLAENGQPLFRVMRGCDRFTWIGGKWNKFDDSGNFTGQWVGEQKVLKHPEAKERYIFEILCPAENYGTEVEWVEQTVKWMDGQLVATLGPYPREGEYELVKVIEKEYIDKKGVCWKKEFVPLTNTIVEAILATAKANLDLPTNIRKERKRMMYENEEKRRKENIAAKIEEIETARPDWAKNPHVVLPSDLEVSKFG